MKPTLLTIAILVASSTSAIVAAPASAADDKPCGGPVAHRARGTVQFCPLWLPKRGFIPVHDFSSGRAVAVGRLNKAGSVNWFDCQSAAPRGVRASYSDPDHPAYSNIHWARTLSDDGKEGWVSQVYFAGGGNDEADAALLPCDGAKPPAPAPTKPQAQKGSGSASSAFVREGQTSCSELKEGQVRAVNFKLTEESYTRISGGSIDRAPKIVNRESKSADLGSLTVRATTCKAPQGWRIVSPVLVEVSSRGLNSKGEPTGDGIQKGWGMGIDSTSPDGISVRAYPCKKGWFWGALKFLNDIPIPKVAYPVDVTKWVAGFFLPEDSVKCKDAGRGRIALRAGREGELRVTTQQDFGSVRTNSDLGGGREYVRSMRATDSPKQSRGHLRPV